MTYRLWTFPELDIVIAGYLAKPPRSPQDLMHDLPGRSVAQIIKQAKDAGVYVYPGRWPEQRATQMMGVV